jgi:hypothetical protein
MNAAGGWVRRLAGRLAGPVRRLAGPVRQASAATPLRVKLIAALLVLVTLALSGTGVAGSYALRGYLMDKVDGQLPDGPVFLGGCPATGPSPPDAGTDRPMSVSYFILKADLRGRLAC